MNDWLTKPVSNGSLELFRIIVGIIIFAEGAGALALGWVRETFVDVPFNFTFIGFEWLNCLNGPYMYIHYGMIAIFGLGIAAGFFYRISAAGFLLFWIIAYLMQKHHYNNHYYLMILMGFWMLILPLGKRFALDVRLGRVAKEYYCPAWSRYVLILQIAIVYFYAAIAKLYPDWLQGIPLSIWLSVISKTHFFGEILADKRLVIFLSYGGILFDFMVVPALLYKKTRWLAVIASLVFHLFNSLVFQIGTFPYLMIGALPLFFPPATIERWISGDKFVRQGGVSPRFILTGFGSAALVVFFLFQMALPLRHWLYPDSVNWTEEGHRMSWRMMLRTKTGYIHFECKNPQTGESWRLYSPSDLRITPDQHSVMAKTPDMIWQCAQRIRRYYKENDGLDVEVYAHCKVSLNGRPYQTYIDPAVNLAKEPWRMFTHSEWILPFREAGDD